MALPSGWQEDPSQLWIRHHQPLIISLILGAMAVLFITAIRLMQPIQYRLRPRHRGRLPWVSQTLLERRRLAKQKDLDELREEQERCSYEGVVTSRPGLLETVFGAGGSSHSQSQLSEAIELGYAVRLRSFWTLWTRTADVAFIELPALPEARPLPPAPPSERARDLTETLGDIFGDFFAPHVESELLSASTHEQILDDIAPVDKVGEEEGKKKIGTWLNIKFGANPSGRLRDVRDRLQRSLHEMHVRRHQAAQPPPPSPEPSLDEELNQMFQGAETEAEADARLEKYLLEFDAQLRADGVDEATRLFRVKKRRSVMQAQLADLFARRKK